MHPLRWIATSLFLVACLSPGGPARADGLVDISADSTTDTLLTYFPNWRNAKAADFDVFICDDTTCAPDTNCPITGLTVWNYGTATGGAAGDLTRVLFNLVCGGTNSVQTLTYAGVWIDSTATARPAWTWGGSIPWAADPTTSCAGIARLSLFADVGPCPVDGATVTLGIAFDDVKDPAMPGGLIDACGYSVPDYVEAPNLGVTKIIRYALKTADVELAAPGDPVTYTIYYGRPGAASTGVVVTDSLPTDTHYVAGSAVPAPDVFWDPDPGPPPRLRWTLPGAAVLGGPTSSLTFKLTPDWGNGEGFEPGSGNQGAVEASRIANSAAVEFLGSGCAAPTQLSNVTDVSVRRYTMWMIADQDILFAPRVGFPDDEVTYSIFVANPASKTWWNVDVWDTVPPELDPWAPGYGFDDPCLGWTMTPGGCAAASPGFRTAGGNTILTWNLDMPPGFTLEMRWKARVNPAGALPGATATNKVNMLALGAPGQVGGTGNARAPRRFIHQALVALRTTYFSYVGQVANSKGCNGLAINFYPLNKATAFELYKLYTDGAGFATTGGKSATIATFVGACAGGYSDGGYGGCGVERAPSQYFWLASCANSPNAALYKLTANAPLIWMLMPDIGGGGDAQTYIPATTLTFSGTVLYSCRRSLGTSAVGEGESWVVANTGIAPDTGAFDPNQGTTAHIFKWNFGTLAWDYVKSADIDGNSLWMPFAGTTVADEDHYKIISSDCMLNVCQGYGVFGDPSLAFDNESMGVAPAAQTGKLVSTPGTPATFYPLTHHIQTLTDLGVGTVGPAATAATFAVYRYIPKDPSKASVGIPVTLCGTSGRWALLGTRVADPGLAGPKNAYWFGGGYDPLTNDPLDLAYAYKVDLLVGGPVTTYCGGNLYLDYSGGVMLHTIDARTSGQEFWLHLSTGGKDDGYGTLVFCPTAGMAVNATSGTGASATYTTDGPDQCIMFMAMTAPGFGGAPLNYSFKLLPGGAQGECMAMYHNAFYREKFFAAPFVNTGVHYDILVPPVVYAGQPFWITVVVVLGTGTTKTDYCGTSSFTSTDGSAKIENVAMDAYNYTWTSSIAPCGAAPFPNGVRLFFNVTLTRLGIQTLVASDIFDGSITGVAGIMVVGADVKIAKNPRFSVAASGDTVQFRVCWSNYSSGSAFAFTVSDAIPQGTTFVPEAATAAFNCGNTNGVTPVVAYSTATTATIPPPASFTDGLPTAAARWLRWTVPMAGIRTTGCFCYRVSVN